MCHGCAVIGGTTQGAQQAMSGGRCVTFAMVEIYCEHGCLISEIKFPTTAYGEMLSQLFPYYAYLYNKLVSGQIKWH